MSDFDLRITIDAHAPHGAFLLPLRVAESAEQWGEGRVRCPNHQSQIVNHKFLLLLSYTMIFAEDVTPPRHRPPHLHPHAAARNHLHRRAKTFFRKCLTLFCSRRGDEADFHPLIPLSPFPLCSFSPRQSTPQGGAEKASQNCLTPIRRARRGITCPCVRLRRLKIF